MSRVLLVRQREAHPWTSVNVIQEHLSNLVQRLGQCGNKVSQVSYSQNFAKELLTSVQEESFDVIVTLFSSSYVTSYQELIEQTLGAARNRPKFFFLVFGDFFTHPERWLFTSRLPADVEVGLICLSEGFRKNVAKFFQNPITFTLDLSLPVERGAELPSRSALQTKNVVYSGRLSEPKNFDILLSSMITAMGSNPGSYRFHVFGSVLDPMVTSHEIAKFRKKIRLILQACSDEVKASIFFHGDVPRTEVLEALQDADLYVSLSTFVGESFGLSPREALAHGVPCLLSRWGGFKDLEEDFPDLCHYVDVHPSTEPFTHDDVSTLISEILQVGLDRKKVRMKWEQARAKIDELQELRKILGSNGAFPSNSPEMTNLLVNKSSFLLPRHISDGDIYKSYRSIFFDEESVL